MSENVTKLVVKSALRIIDAEKLGVDASYQREVKRGHESIVAHFDEVAFGVPLVGEREDSSLWIVDGLQRITAARKLGKVKLRCEVFNSRGPEHEAAVFNLVNMKRTKLSSVEEFRALLTAGEPLAWQIKECVEAHGFKLKTSVGSDTRKTRDYISCVSTLRRIVAEKGTESLGMTLDVVREAWPEDPLGVNSKVVHGMCIFFDRHECLVDVEKLLTRLKTTTPYKLMYQASQAAMLGGGSGQAYAFTDVVERLYAKRVRKAK